MTTFAFLLLCVQACLVQTVYSQCLRGAPAFSPAAIADPFPFGYGYGANFVAPGYTDGLYGLGTDAIIPYGAYGGNGVGDVAIAGELPVAGTTLIAGQVPILGAVRFEGALPAAGAVTITGSSGYRGSCGCI